MCVDGGDRRRYEADEAFQIILTEPSKGVNFEAECDGFPDRCICTITITNDQQRQEVVDNISRCVAHIHLRAAHRHRC